jgi:hypothetical protein
MRNQFKQARVPAAEFGCQFVDICECAPGFVPEIPGWSERYNIDLAPCRYGVMDEMMVRP